jgi:hypothetical protein
MGAIYDYPKGDTRIIGGRKVIHVSNACYAYETANYILPFYRESLPESGKCFLNGRHLKPQQSCRVILTERTLPFFKRNG